jgi:hypothetical protein
MHEAVPGRGEIVLRSGIMDTTAPGKVTVNDGSGGDIDESPFVHQVSAGWSAAEDGESGIARYWYRIGTTPGGSEVVDWIDNGLERTMTTTRTKFSLVRGEKYFVTIKAVNGAGLESESVSDGFIVNAVPGHISFLENFDTGYLNQWDEKFARTGSTSNLLYTSVQATRDGKYGLQVHLAASNRNTPRLVKREATGAKDIFTRLYFRLDKDFKMPAEGSLQILELNDSGGEFIAGVFLGYREGIGFHVYTLYLDDTGYRASLPGISPSYPLSYTPAEADRWHRIDIRTIADEGKGGAEFWLNGVREGCIMNRFSAAKAVRSVSIGALSIPDGNVSGEIYFDDVTVSDSVLK